MATNQTPPSECITIEQRLHKHVPPTQPQSNITTNTTNTVNDTNSNINPIPNVITILPRSTEQPRSSPAFEEQTNTRPPAIEEPNINNGNGSSNNGNGSSNNGNNDTDAGSSSSSRNSVAISTKKAVLKGVGGNIKSEFKAKTTKSTITSQKKEEIAANMKKFMSQNELKELCVKVGISQSTTGGKDRMIERIMAKTNELEGAAAAIASAIEVAINKRKKEEVEAGEKKRKRDEDEEAKRIEKAEKKEKKRKRDEDEDAKRKAKKAKYDSAASVAQREKDRKKLEAAQLSPHCSGDLSNGTTATMSFNGDNDVTYFDNHDYRTAKWMQVNTLLHLGTIDAHPHIQLLYNNEDVRTNQSNTIEKRSLSSTAMDEIVLLCRRSGTVPSLHIKPALTETDKQKGLFESPGRKLVLEAIKRYAV